jgi:hypothetical protein
MELTEALLSTRILTALNDIKGNLSTLMSRREVYAELEGTYWRKAFANIVVEPIE